MRTTVVTAGSRRSILLRRLLQVEFDQANGDLRLLTRSYDSNADSLARSILLDDHQPVALVVDADSINPDRIQEQREWYEDSLGVAPRQLSAVFLGVPEWLSLLFANRAILENLTGAPVTDAQFLRGHYEPQVVLAELLKERGISDEEFDRRLGQADLTPLRQLSPVRELVEFVAQHALTPAA